MDTETPVQITKYGLYEVIASFSFDKPLNTEGRVTVLIIEDLDQSVSEFRFQAADTELFRRLAPLLLQLPEVYMLCTLPRGNRLQIIGTRRGCEQVESKLDDYPCFHKCQKFISVG